MKKENLSIIDNIDLKDDETHLLNLEYEMFSDDQIAIYTKNGYLVIWENSYSPFQGKRTSSQQEYPLMALPWFVDKIEYKFWNNRPSSNNLPGDISESVIITNEKIGINPMRHCCAENLPGYSFWNSSRESYISRRAHHDWQVPRYMLEEGLLLKLKKISTDLGLKAYL